MSLQKFFKSKVNRFLTALGAISIALGGLAFSVNASFNKTNPETEAVASSRTHDKIWLKLDNNYWGSATAYYTVHIWGGTSGTTWPGLNMQDENANQGVSGGGQIYADVPSQYAGWTHLILVRYNDSGHTNEGNRYNFWSDGGDGAPNNSMTAEQYNYFQCGDWGGSGPGWTSTTKATITEYRVLNGTKEASSFQTEYAYYDTPFYADYGTVPSGYVFDNWYTDEACTVLYSATTYTTDQILYASFSTAPSYTVTFESNGGTTVTPQSVVSGSTATKPSDPTKSNYTFVDWYSDSSLTTVYNFSTAVTGNLTLYAKWTPVTYAIGEYEVVNGTLNSTKIATEYATYGVNFTPTDIAKSGYSLIGWYTDSACTTAYTATAWTAAGNLYAKYAQQYTVTKKAVVGVNPIDSGTETALYGVAFNPTAPSITGFTVSGWYTNQACTTAYVASATAITSVTTLYAKMTASSSFTLVADTATADFPSGYTNNTDNWSTAKIIYVYCFNASYNSGLVAMTRSTVNGYYTLSISSTWTGVVFCIGSSWPDSSSYWRQSNDVTLTATTGEQGYVITGSTTASSKSGVQKLTTYSNQAASSGRPVYVRNDTALSGSPLVIYKAWNASTPYANARYGLTKAVNGSTTLFSFVLDTAYDSFCITMRYNSTVWSTTGAITYAFNTIDSSNPAVLSLTAVASSTYSRIVFNWLSLYQTTNGSSDTYVSAPLPGSSFFRFWISRPSGAFNGDNDVSYEAGYLWSLTVNNGGVTTEIMPKGYVIDSVYRSTESGKTDLRVFSYYDVPMTYKDCTYRWLCRNSSAASGATVVQVADFSTNSLLTDRSVSTRTGDILFLTYNGGITTSWGTCDYSSVTLLKVVMQGYFTCRSDVLNGYGDFAHIDQTWFSTSTVQYARCTATVNTRSSSTDGSGLMAAASLSDYDYNGGSYSYNGSPSATTSLALKYARMYIPSTNKAWGSNTIFGPIKTNEASSISSTLIIVGCSGGAGFLFIAIIYLVSRRKKKVRI
jgi:uncharacterized repeat protein (TIGR02543 family)